MRVFVSGVLLLSCGVAAQARTAQRFAKGYLPYEHSFALAAGDVDGDGSIDVFAHGRLFMGGVAAGPTLFEEAPLPTTWDRSGSGQTVRLGDIDGDGDLDALALPFDQLFTNDGAGRFSDVTSTQWPPPGPYVSSTAEFVDVDGDGDLDAVVGAGGSFLQLGQDQLYLNDGTGTFRDATSTHLPARLHSTATIAVGDIDGDGDPDLAFGNGRLGVTASDLVLVNDGAGRFAASTRAVPARVSRTTAMRFADFDRDGDLDLALVGPGLTILEPARVGLWENDGSGGFTDVTSVRVQSNFGQSVGHGLEIGDIDRDGDDDLIAGVVHLNDGTGTLVAQATRSVGPEVLVDLDADGDLDALSGRSVFVFDRRGVPQERTIGRWLEPATRFERVDVDGDLVDDVVFDLTGLANPFALAEEYGFVVADLDGDLDQDLLLLSAAVSVGQAFLGDGTGTFIARPSFSVPFQIGGIIAEAIGDIDGDGDADLILGFDDQFTQNALCIGNSLPPRIYLNDGSAQFAPAPASHMPNDLASTAAVALADVDGDGDLDAALATGSVYQWPCDPAGQNRLYLNDGSGRFTDQTAPRLPVDQLNSVRVEAADVDGDGDVDLAFASESVEASLYLNDGTGRFTDAGPGALPLNAAPRGVLLPLRSMLSLVDLDEDGDVDAVGLDQVALNDGGGTFSVATRPYVPPPATGVLSDPLQVVSLSDVDLDGDVDLTLQPVFGSERVVFLNLHRQLTAPDIARLGRPYRLQLDSRPGYASLGSATVGAILVGFAPARIETPFGWLGIDPRTAVALPGFLTIPSGGGRAQRILSVPTSTALLDTVFFAQGLVVEPGAALRLTNLISDQVVGG